MSHGEVKGIDETSTVVGGGAGQRARRVADVSRHWALRFGAAQPFPMFSVPRAGADGTVGAEALRAFDEALRHAAVALAALAAADFRAFWSTVVTADAPARFLGALLRTCPHAWCAHTARARAVLARPALRGVVLGARDVFVRLLRRADSATLFVGAPAHAQYLRALGCADAPALIAACALFGPLAPTPCDEDAFVLAVRALLADEPLVARPLLADCARIAPAIIATLALSSPSPSSSSQEGESKEGEKEEADGEDDEEADAMDALLDAVATLAAFLRVATACAAPFVRAGLLPQLARCHAQVAARLPHGDTTTAAGATAARVLRLVEACAASAVMFAWLAVFAGAPEHLPPPPPPPTPDAEGVGDDRETARERERAEAAAGLLAFLRSAGDAEHGTLARALDDRCDLGGRVRALAAQHPTAFPRAQVDAVLLILGRSTSSTGSTSSSGSGGGSGNSGNEAFPALPVSGVDQLLSLFPGADIAKLQAALAACGGRVEAVVARVCEGDLDVRPAVAEAPVLPEPLAEGARVVVLRGKGDAKSLGDGDASGEGQGSEAMKDAILARLARMEEEEERERIRRYEAQRLRRGAGAADVYADDYDDSFDDFVRYDFQDGEELGDGDDDSDDGGEGAAVPAAAAAAAAAAPVVVPQQQSQQQGGRGGGRGGRGGGRRGKNHHQSDRAMSKRNRGMVPIARP